MSGQNLDDRTRGYVYPIIRLSGVSIMRISGPGQARVRLGSGSGQARVRPWSGSGQALVRPWSGSGQARVRLGSG